MLITPTRKEFKNLTKKGNLIPLFCEVIADMETPVSAYYKICAGEKNKTDNLFAFLLESIDGGENIARYSFLGISPNSIFIQKDGIAELIDQAGGKTVNGCDVFDRINQVLKKFRPNLKHGGQRGSIANRSLMLYGKQPQV